MSIKRALDNILEGNLDEMRQNFSSALTTKAVEKLEERKIDIAKNYFGQMQEEVEALDEVAVPDRHKEAMRKAYGPGRVTVSNGMIHHKNNKFGETISHKYDPKKKQPIGQHLGTITVDP